jgi:hypothetical protein
MRVRQLGESAVVRNNGCLREQRASTWPTRARPGRTVPQGQDVVRSHDPGYAAPCRSANHWTLIMPFRCCRQATVLAADGSQIAPTGMRSGVRPDQRWGDLHGLRVAGVAGHYRSQPPVLR